MYILCVYIERWSISISVLTGSSRPPTRPPLTVEFFGFAGAHNSLDDPLLAVSSLFPWIDLCMPSSFSLSTLLLMCGPRLKCFCRGCVYKFYGSVKMVELICLNMPGPDLITAV